MAKAMSEQVGQQVHHGHHQDQDDQGPLEAEVHQAVAVNRPPDAQTMVNVPLTTLLAPPR